MTLAQLALYGDLDGEADQPTAEDIEAHCRASWPDQPDELNGSIR